MAATKHEFYTPTTDVFQGFDTTYITGQTFTVGTTGANENHTISSVKLLMWKGGSPGTITVAIRAVDGSGLPTGSDLSTGTTNGDTLTTDPAGEVREITMSSYELQASTKYALLMKSAVYSPPTNWAFANILSSGSSYTGGHFLYYEASWNELAGADFYFEIWGEAAATGTNISLNVGDVWKDVTNAYVNVGDVWKEVASASVNVGDVWKTIF